MSETQPRSTGDGNILQFETLEERFSSETQPRSTGDGNLLTLLIRQPRRESETQPRSTGDGNILQKSMCSSQSKVRDPAPINRGWKRVVPPCRSTRAMLSETQPRSTGDGNKDSSSVTVAGVESETQPRSTGDGNNSRATPLQCFEVVRDPAPINRGWKPASFVS